MPALYVSILHLLVASQLVIVGSVSPALEVPWHVTIYIENAGQEEKLCGGSIVSGEHVLTAAHCLDGVAFESKVSLKFQPLQVKNPRYFQILEYSIHPQYDAVTRDHDIAVLRLKLSILAWKTWLKKNSIRLTTDEVPDGEPMYLTGLNQKNEEHATELWATDSFSCIEEPRGGASMACAGPWPEEAEKAIEGSGLTSMGALAGVLVEAGCQGQVFCYFGYMKVGWAKNFIDDATDFQAIWI